MFPTITVYWLRSRWLNEKESKNFLGCPLDAKLSLDSVYICKFNENRERVGTDERLGNRAYKRFFTYPFALAERQSSFRQKGGAFQRIRGFGMPFLRSVMDGVYCAYRGASLFEAPVHCFACASLLGGGRCDR